MKNNNKFENQTSKRVVVNVPHLVVAAAEEVFPKALRDSGSDS